MENKKRLVVLTGAGMSAESGLAVFRGSNGLWSGYRIEDVATPEGWIRNPQQVLDFYNARRRELLTVKPNDGHKGLAALETDFDVRIITQNVDNLHEQAGSRHIIHLHGELMKVRSSRYENLIYDVSPDHIDTHIGDLCEKGYQLRPHIVWFGEAVPLIEPAIEEVEKADIFVDRDFSERISRCRTIALCTKRNTGVSHRSQSRKRCKRPCYARHTKGGRRRCKRVDKNSKSRTLTQIKR